MYALIDKDGRYLSLTDTDGELSVLKFSTQEEAESFRDLFSSAYKDCRIIVYSE